MNAWSHLPNAAHIDRVLAHVRAHPDRWDAAWDTTRYAAYVAAWGAARGALAALIAWDDCASILDMPVDTVKSLAASGNHPAVLLLSAVLAMEESK